jgi:16S rRNA (uracil1498-N3)-methyltransferase
VSLVPHVLVPGALVDEVPGTVVPLRVDSVHHLRRVLRRVEGSALTLTDGAGSRASAELAVGGARLTAAPESVGPAVPRLVLAQSLAKGRRADDAVRVACELGVDRIVPIVADRTQGRPDERSAAAVVDRWQALAVSALEQSRGVHLAQVTGCRSTTELAEDAGGADAAADVTRDTRRDDRTVRLVSIPGARRCRTWSRERRWTPHRLPSCGSRSVRRAVGVHRRSELLVGAGWLPVGLGPTVLRTEHAGPVAVAVLAALAGRWRGIAHDGLGGQGG